MGSNVWLSGGVASSSDPGAVRRNVVTASARSVRSQSISKPSVGQGFVQGDPVFDSISKGLEGEISELIEIFNNIRVEPASIVGMGVQVLRQVPVVEGDEGSDVIFDKQVNNLVVEIYSFLVNTFLSSVREDSGPGDGESVVLESKGLHELDVLGELVVVVISNISGLVVRDFA